MLVKKALIIVLAAVMLILPFTGCGENGNATTDVNKGSTSDNVIEENKEIELTSSNLLSYLAFDFSYDEINTTKILGIGFYDTYVNIRMYPTEPGVFSGVYFKVKIECPDAVTVDKSDPTYNSDDDRSIYLDVVLPSSGEYTKRVKLFTVYKKYFNDPDFRVHSYDFSSVSGTFTEK